MRTPESEQRFRGKTALVTGWGMGRAAALEPAALRADVYCPDVNEAAVQQVILEIGSAARPIRLLNII